MIIHWPETAPQLLAVGEELKKSVSTTSTFWIAPSDAEMDALFDSIDVRDLLSTHDLSDSTAPLSAPDLRLLISRLETHSLRIKTKIHSYLLPHHQDFSNLFSLCTDAVSQYHHISNDVESILHLLSDPPLVTQVREIIEDIKEKTKEEREKRELFNLVTSIVELTARFDTVKEAVRSGRFQFAAEELRELKKALGIRNDHCDEQRDPLVYTLLRKEWFRCFEEIQDVLVKFMENAVRFERESDRVLVKSNLSVDGNDGNQLHTVLYAMDVVGILDYGLAKVADMFLKFVISPALTSSSSISFVEDLTQEPEEKNYAILKLVHSPEKVDSMSCETIYSMIIQVIKFMYEHLCFQNKTWIRCFGRLTWPRISELIISNFLSKVVPKDASKLVEFERIIKCTSEFENALEEMMFISTSDCKDESLRNFTENVEVHFATRKKTEILKKARNLLLECDFSVPHGFTKGSTEKNNEAAIQSSRQVELLIFSERCVVSEAATLLMELVHQTLEDVCLSSTRVAFELYRAARDAILLYEVVIPTKLERQLDSINQAAILMHNDCLYISQEILGLAFEYRSNFPESMKEYAVFVDLAPRFHLMAEEVLQRQIQLVIYNLKEAIDGAGGFQNTHERHPYESAKFSVDQVVFILEKVRLIWEPLLLPSKYESSMCTVLESVLYRITRDIILLDDIAVQETLELQRLIHLMLENISSLLDSLNASHQENSQDTLAQNLNELIPSLRKFRKLADLLDMPLKSITMQWESGELINCGFILAEVEDFIKAIFSDSPLRKECLWKIKNATV